MTTTDTEKTPAQRLISLSDIGNLIGLPIFSLISWLLPSKWANRFCEVFGALNTAMLTSDANGLVGKIRATVGDRSLAIDPEKIPDAVAKEDLYALFWVLRSHRSKSWDGKVELKGKEHLDAALARRNGAILWRAHFAHSGLPYYKALSNAGYKLSHFSHERHGFSDTRFGIKFLNPIRISAEDLYLHERVVRTDAPSMTQLLSLCRQLNTNGIVSIATRGTGANFISAPFMNAHHEIALGALYLAYVKNAALLPVFPVRNANDTYTIIIEPPIEISTTQARHVAIENAAGEYAARLEACVLKFPEQWLGWMHL